MQRTKFFVILDHFLPFTPLPEKSKFGKNEKKAWTYYYFTHVYQKWQSWCMVPEIWSLTNWFFCHCGPFFALLPPPHPLTTPPPKKNFLKMIKNASRYYPFTHVYHKWKSYDNGSSDTEHNRQNFLSFRTIFCSFTP